MMELLASALRRELVFLRTSPWDLGLLVVFPALIMAMMSALFLAGTPRDLPLAVVDADQSVLSRSIVRAVDATPGVSVTARAQGLAQAWPMVRAERVYGVLYIPPNFGRDARSESRAHSILFYNASFTTMAGVLQKDIGAAYASANLSLLSDDVARLHPHAIRPPPVKVQTTTLFNAFGSYEWLLVGSGHPATLAILVTCAMIAAIGREFAAGSIGVWIGARSSVGPALMGKAAPYLVVFLIYALLGIVWLAGVRGFRVAGSMSLLICGIVLMLLAYAFLAALVTTVFKDSVAAFGVCGLYAASALAYSGTTFPSEGATWLARMWSDAQPLTWYLRVQAEQWQAGASWRQTLPELGVLAAYTLVSLPLAIFVLRRARSAIT